MVIMVVMVVIPASPHLGRSAVLVREFASCDLGQDDHKHKYKYQDERTLE